MDIISYGVASKASSQEKKIRTNVLGKDVTGSYPDVDARLSAIEKTMEGVSLSTDTLTIQNTINIMKSNARLNALTKTKKYQMHQMVFDDLLDLSGIDPALSSGYTHDALEGSVTSGVIVTTPIETDSVPTKAILIVEEVVSTGTENIALDKKVSIASGTFSYPNNIYYVTRKNNVTRVSPNSTGALKIDLGENYLLNKIHVIQHEAHESPYNYQNVKLTLTTNEGTSTTIDAGSVPGTVVGKKVPVKDQPARYITWSCGYNSRGYSADFVRIEAYAAPSSTSYFISRNNGETWEPIIPEELFTFSDAESLNATSRLRIKAELNGKSQLLNYALTWI